MGGTKGNQMRNPRCRGKKLCKNQVSLHLCLTHQENWVGEKARTKCKAESKKYPHLDGWQKEVWRRKQEGNAGAKSNPQSRTQT
jgi:hypothetical protein